MKIGILTLPLHTNYGGILQAYALQTVLERMGHEVEIINVPFTLPSISKVEVENSCLAYRTPPPHAPFFPIPFAKHKPAKSLHN